MPTRTIEGGGGPETPPVATQAPAAAAAYDAASVGPTQPVATLAPAATPQIDNYRTRVYKAGLAGRLDISSIRTNEMFKWLDPESIRQVPFTLAHTTSANQDEGLSYAVNDAVVWMSTVYGNEALGSYVLSSLIQDPTSRSRTQAVLFDVAGIDLPSLNPTQGFFNPQSEEVANAFNEVTTSADPLKAFGALDPAMKLGVQSLAAQFQDSIQSAAQAGNPIADQLGRVIAVAQNGYRVVLSQTDLNILSTLAQGAQTGVGGTTQGNLGPQAESLGITQIRRIGEGQIVLDSEWARANPDEALAEKQFLEAQYPGAEIVLGKQGILGSVLDKFGMAIDYSTALGGAALHQVSEELNRFGSGDRQANLNAIAQATRTVNSGGPVPDWVAALMKQYGEDPTDPQAVTLFLQHAENQNTVDVGLGAFWQDLKDNTRPKMLGFGLADNIMKAADLLPGDPEYSVAHTAVGILSQFAADPAMWGPAVIGGLRDAGTFARLLGDTGGIPKFIDAATGAETVLQVSNSTIHQWVYAKLARTAEEAVQTKPFLRAASSLYDVREAAGSEGAFATLLHDVAGVDLEEARRMATMVTSKEGGAIALLDDALGTGRVETLDRIYGIQDKLDAINANLVGASESVALATGRDTEYVDLLAQKHVYESILQGHDAIRDATAGFMGGKQIRRLRTAAGLKPSIWDEAVDAVGRSIAEFPANLIVRNSESLAHIETLNPQARPAIQVMFAKLGHIWRSPGFASANERFILEDATAFSEATGVEKTRQAVIAAEKAGNEKAYISAKVELDAALTDMVNSPNASMARLHDIAREHGLSDARYRQLIEPYVSGQLKGDLAGQWQWFKDTYSSIIDESTVYDGLAKKGARDLYETWLDDRAGARISVSGTQGDPVTEAVFTRKLPGTIPYSIPTIDADLARQIPLPSLQEFRSYATMTGRTMKQWEAAGDVRKAISLSHGALTRSWRTATSWWRSWILGSRIFGALPARIVGEQQLRMAAYGYDSMVWHPSEWFSSTNWGAHFFADDAAMWDAAGSPVHALGTMVDDMRGRVPMLNKAVASIDGGIVGEQDAFFRSYSQMLTKYAASPSVTRWRLADGEIASPEEVIRAIRNETVQPLVDTWTRQFELTRGLDDTRPASEVMASAVNRWDQEMRQLVGYDPENIIKRAITDRKVIIDGETFTVGTSQFAKKLQELRTDGRWEPGMRQLPTKLGEYLPGDKTSLMGDFTQKLFRMFYSRPDLATSRVPLYRQMFKRQYQNLIKLGYEDGRAVEVAQSFAASGTADLLFQLGAHTNGEYLLREVMPFFPAYRELATTWIGRIPAHLGGLEESHAAALGWVLGAGALTERANLVLKSATEMGLVHQDPNGNYYVSVPLFGNLLSWMTFGNVKFNSHVPLESLAGILPVPFGFGNTDDEGRPLPLADRLRGMLPTIGGPAVPILALLKSKYPSFFGPVEDWVTMFGSDTSLGIPLIDQIWEGVTHSASPFALGRAETLHQAQINFALIDGMRLAIHENPMPAWPGPNLTNAQSTAYEKKWLAWRSTILKAGSNYQQHLYLLKSAIGAVLPFSVQFSDEYKTSVATMWQMLNHLPGGSTSPVGRAEMNLFLDRNPDLEPFLTSKTLDTRLYDDPHESLQDFMRAVAAGDVKVRNANDWVTYAVATNSFSEHMANVAAIRENAGKTWQQVLMNFDAKQALTDEQNRWEAYLDWNHKEMAALGIPDARSMLDQVQQYKAIRAGRVPQITLDQQRLISFDQTMRHYASYFDLNPEKAGRYANLRSAAYDALFGSLGEPSDISKGISKWFDKTADPYYSKLDDLYSKLTTAKPNEVEPIYSDIRQLSDRYDTQSRRTGDPTPEEYLFAKKTPVEQKQTVAKWAALPAVYLTAFQRRQVGYEGDDTSLTKYANYSSWLNTQMRKYAQEAGIGVGTVDWDKLTERRDQFLASKARVLKVTDTVHDFNAPTYVRVGRALDLQGTPGWDHVTTLVHQADTWLASVRGGDGVSPAGSTVEAVQTRELFGRLVEELRQNDPHLDNALNEIAAAVDKTNHYQLYSYLFFDVLFGT